MNFYAEGKYVHRPFIDRAELLDRVTTVVVGLNTILVIVVIGIFIRSYATVNHINCLLKTNTLNNFSFGLLKFEEKGWE
jgi:hypothetical protein